MLNLGLIDLQRSREKALHMTSFFTKVSQKNLKLCSDFDIKVCNRKIRYFNLNSNIFIKFL